MIWLLFCFWKGAMVQSFFKAISKAGFDFKLTKTTLSWFYNFVAGSS
jgi:hypothetical protein